MYDTPDYIFTNHGSLWLCMPQTADARAHLADNVGDESQWYAGALAVEPRYVESLAAGLEGNGYSVEL